MQPSREPWEAAARLASPLTPRPASALPISLSPHRERETGWFVCSKAQTLFTAAVRSRDSAVKMNCQIKDLYKYKKNKKQSTLKKCQPNNCLWRALFQLIGREKGEKRSSHPKNEIKLGLNQLNRCSPFSVTGSNYPKQTQRCITVTNDFKTTKLATNAKSQKEGLKKKKKVTTTGY